MTNGIVFFGISGRVDSLARYAEYFGNFLSGISAPLDFPPEMTEFSVEWFAYRKCTNFRIFRNFSRQISVAFVSGSKFSEF